MQAGWSVYSYWYCTLIYDHIIIWVRIRIFLVWGLCSVVRLGFDLFVWNCLIFLESVIKYEHCWSKLGDSWGIMLTVREQGLNCYYCYLRKYLAVFSKDIARWFGPIDGHSAMIEGCLYWQVSWIFLAPIHYSLCRGFILLIFLLARCWI